MRRLLPLPTSPHRTDIDGLRGVAVLSVFAVHSIPDAVHGGFVGVDVFFVISGYLICLLTLQAQAEGRFSMLGFYARRIRRIVPALLLVLMVCLLFAVTVAFPRESREVGKHVAGGAAFVSNWVLWGEAGYFDQSSELKPLLHLWSLGIEEQFYLVWPLFALVMARWRQRAIVFIVLALLVSFALNMAFVESKPKGTFFLPITRFWELLIGVGLAHCMHWVEGGPVGAVARACRLRPTARAHLSNVCSAIGALLLVLAVMVVDNNRHFPGAWALMPTLGTAGIIAAGPGAWVNRCLLSGAVLQFYGRISFSLYLWHWPLLTFPLLLGYRLELLQMVGVLCLSVALAYLTQRWVEAPARHSLRAPFTVPWLLLGLCAVGLAGAALSASDGLLWRYPALVRTIASEHLRQDLGAVRLGTCFQTSAAARQAHAQECTDRQPAEAPLLLLWGDSFAASLYPGLRALVDERALPMRLAQFTGPLCPPLPQGSARQLDGCEAMNDVVLAQVRRERPALVVLAGSWATYQPLGDGSTGEVAGLAQTIAQLRSLGVARVVVVGTLPVWRAAQPRLLLSAWQRSGEVPSRLAAALAPHPLALDSLVAEQVRRSGAEFISAYDLLCNADGCQTTLLRDGQLHPTAHDEAHLTATASRHLALAMLPQLTSTAARVDGQP